MGLFGHKVVPYDPTVGVKHSVLLASGGAVIGVGHCLAPLPFPHEEMWFAFWSLSKQQQQQQQTICIPPFSHCLQAIRKNNNKIQVDVDPLLDPDPHSARFVSAGPVEPQSHTCEPPMWTFSPDRVL